MQSAIVIGSGFAGLSTACFLAKEGLKVTVIEKNGSPGGRARAYSAEGFTFDMGPSWYWMPEVFEHFFARFGKKPSDYYDLVRLDPSYQVFWDDDAVDIPADYAALQDLFEQYEKGAGNRLDAFLTEAKYKYEVGLGKLVYQPGLSLTEFMRMDVLSGMFRLDLLQSIHKHVRRFFRHPKLLQLAEFPILFLGALPQNTPALYSLMNYADMKGGTWYPMGGMVKIAEGMHALATELGVQFQFNEPVERILCEGAKATGVKTDKSTYAADLVITACDYEHGEQALLPENKRRYDKSYWERRSMAPSCLLYYIGLSKKLDGLRHHNLFFDAPFGEHAAELYSHPQWPSNPLLYVCCPSRTDDSVAPAGCENLFVLIPVAPGLAEDANTRGHYFEIAMRRIEKQLGTAVREHIVYSRSYAGADFTADYNAFKGNAYGLANTLRQTAILKPSIRSKKLRNLFYTGQLTVPGPGVPPALISGEVVAKEALRTLRNAKIPAL